jgi:hypothetical protein
MIAASREGTMMDEAQILSREPPARGDQKRVNVQKTAVVLGTLIAGCHIFWTLLILTGWAQPVLNFVFWAHMIQPVYVVKSFDPRAAITLVVITFFSGYALGLFGAILWNKLHRTYAKSPN